MSEAVTEPGDIKVVLGRLLADWEATDREFAGRKDLALDRVMVTFGLAAHAHVMAASFLKQYEDGEPLQALPTARMAYEHALMAQWIAQNPDAVDGFYNESLRHRKNLAKTLATLNWETAVQVADDLEAADPNGRRVPQGGSDRGVHLPASIRRV